MTAVKFDSVIYKNNDSFYLLKVYYNQSENNYLDRTINVKRAVFALKGKMIQLEILYYYFTFFIEDI